jgi:hypothetical protein
MPGTIEIRNLVMTQLGQEPQAWVPLWQFVGPPPSRQSSEQSGTFVQSMTQGPSHSTMQDEAEPQSMTLPGPALTLHCPEFSQSKLQFGPQIAPHLETAVQLTAQLAPQAAEQSCMSSHTPPQRSTLWQYWSQPGPSQLR